MSETRPDQRHDRDAVAEERSGARLPERPAAQERAGFSWRAKGSLAIASTLVATATGMISLRNEIWPPDNDNAVASVALYEQSVGEICSSLNDADRARAANARRLAKRLRSASGRTPLGQQNALLDSIKPLLQKAEHNLARFKALDPPRPRARLHRETEAVWEDSVQRLRSYAQHLDAAKSGDDVLTAVEVLSAARAPLARDGVKRAANLIKLADGRCRLDEPIVTPTITLPDLASAGGGNPANRERDPQRRLTARPGPRSRNGTPSRAARGRGRNTSASVEPALTPSVDAPAEGRSGSAKPSVEPGPTFQAPQGLPPETNPEPAADPPKNDPPGSTDGKSPGESEPPKGPPAPPPAPG